MHSRTKILCQRLAELKARLADATKRGESETYLSLYRFKIEELELTITREAGVAPIINATREPRK